MTVTNMPRCNTCKWWGYIDGRAEFYTYEGVIPKHWRLCLKTYRDHWLVDATNELAAVAGFEFDGLATAPDFGCVQHVSILTPPEDGVQRQPVVD